MLRSPRPTPVVTVETQSFWLEGRNQATEPQRRKPEEEGFRVQGNIRVILGVYWENGR